MSQNYDYLVNQGYQLYSQRDYHRALEIYKQLIKINPSEYGFYHMVGLCYYDSGKRSESLPYFDDAIRLNPNYEDSHYMKGSVLYAQGNYTESDICYDKAIEIKANHYLSYYQKGNIQYYYYQNKREALKLYDKVLLINNNYGPAYTQKGLTLYDLDKINDALNILYTAVTLDPNDYLANYSLGQCYFKLEDFQKAIPYLEVAQRINPNDYSSYSTIGQSQMALGKYDQAIENFLVVARLNPTYSDNFINIGLVYQRKGMYNEAIATYEQVIHMNPNDNLAYNNKATCLQVLGKYSEAIKIYDVSIEKNPKYPLSYCNRAKCKHALGKDFDALDDLNIAFKLFNDKEGIRDLQSTGIKYIQYILDHDRHELLKQVHQINQDLTHLETDYDLSVKAATEKIRGNFSKKLGITINVITDETLQTSKDDYHELLRLLKEIHAEVKKIKEDMKEIGASEEAQIKREYHALEKESLELCDYCKTFYWTLFNYFGAYRAMSIEIFKSNGVLDEPEKDSVIDAGLSKIAGYAGQIFQGVPMFGGIITGIDKIIGDLYGAYSKRNMENKITVITSLVIEKSLSDNDLSIKIAKSAISVTRSRANEILSISGREPSTGKVAKLEKSITSLVLHAQNKFNEVKETYDTETKKLALKDVTVLLAYLYKNTDKLPKGFALDEQLKSIIIYGGYDTIIEGAYEAPEKTIDKSRPTSEDSSGACKISCSVF